MRMSLFQQSQKNYVSIVFFSGDYEKEVNCSQQVVMFVTIKSS